MKIRKPNFDERPSPFNRDNGSKELVYELTEKDSQHDCSLKLAIQ